MRGMMRCMWVRVRCLRMGCRMHCRWCMWHGLRPNRLMRQRAALCRNMLRMLRMLWMQGMQHGMLRAGAGCRCLRQVLHLCASGSADALTEANLESQNRSIWKNRTQTHTNILCSNRLYVCCSYLFTVCSKLSSMRRKTESGGYALAPSVARDVVPASAALGALEASIGFAAPPGLPPGWRATSAP